MQQLSILKPYIDLIKSGLAKLPKHQGSVFRIMNGVDPITVRKQFVKGQEWESKSFLSTSEGKPLDRAQVSIEIRNTSQGGHVSSVNPFPEREVLFVPGTKARVTHVIELPGERFFIIMEAQ